MEVIFQQLLQPAGVVGTLAICALAVVWREWRNEAKARNKDNDRNRDRLEKIIAQHHDFAHTLEAFTRAQEKRLGR